MKQKQKLAYALGGFALGVLLTAAIWLYTGRASDTGAFSHLKDIPSGTTAVTSRTGLDETAALRAIAEQGGGTSSAFKPPSDTWDSAAVYTGGDVVSYQGRRYRAKWWTQGELPGSSDVWEELGIVDGAPAQPEGSDNVPVDASVPRDTALTDFKVVGYYPSWKPDKLQSVDFNVVTHVCYAFAIPTADGGLEIGSKGLGCTTAIARQPRPLLPISRHP